MAIAKNSIEGRSEPFLKRIENLMTDGESAKGEYLAECKVRKEDLKEVYTEAKEAGVPVKSLRGLVRYRELERKQNAIADGLDMDEVATYQNLVEALGPLGMAAAKAAGHAPEAATADAAA